MPEVMTFGQLMLSEILPPDVYKPGQPVNKKALSVMLEQVAKRYPERYVDISHKLVRLGLKTGESLGGASFGMKDLRPSQAILDRQEGIRQQMKVLLDQHPPGPERKAAIISLLRKEADELPKFVTEDGRRNGNRFMLQLEGAGRGNAKSLTSMLAGDVLVENSSGDPIAVPITRGYSQGQTPGQYFATSYGGRKGIVDTKLSVGASGYLSKLLQQAAHRLVVVGDDDDEADPAELRGLVVDAADPDNVGALLAQDVGPFKRNTVITPSMLTTLHKAGGGKVLIRSPLAASTLSGGLYAKDVGVREFGRLPRRGEHVGQPASQSIGEKVTQTSLSSKHTGGAAGSLSATPGLAGFQLIERLVNPPKEGRGLAIHAQQDGIVRAIRPAAQGGVYVMIGEREHYVSPEFTPTIKVHDTVEAGDQLTNGIADPAEVVRHKGIGEGRLAFVNSLRSALGNGAVSRRNLELLATGLIDRVSVSRPFAGHLPGSLVPYGRVERLYRPRKDAKRQAVSSSQGRYLERPVLHYTIGTRVTPSVMKTLRGVGVSDIVTHADVPPFEPVPVRAADVLQSDPDFMTQFYGSHLQKGLLKAIQSGGESDENSTSFIPLRASALNLGKPGFLFSDDQVKS